MKLGGHFVIKLVALAYIAHPYSATSSELRKRNVMLAARLSTLVNSAGLATISPLQESRGRSHALSESGWIHNGLITLYKCDCVVLPTHYRSSRGCVTEYELASELSIPTFFAELTAEKTWKLSEYMLAWIKERQCQ